MPEFIEKSISNLIENQFPNYYREEGPVFVEFVKTYYQWMEQSNNTVYHSRRLMEYGDVDETVDDFIVYFKEKYLKGIQFETQTNTRQLIKHTLDLYRSKGTERSVSLLFALVFGESASVYYPAEDLFRLSDGQWVKPTYLEITSRQNNQSFVGKQIRGLNSGATAFVERLIRRKIRSKYIEVFYISAVNGNFETNEKIVYDGADVKDSPFMVGSVTTFDVIDGGQGFSVGDIVDVTSVNGVQAKGRVVSVNDVTGIVDFELVFGGWGYSSNAEILVSEKVLTLSNVVVTDSGSNDDLPLNMFEIFETLYQPLATIEYEYANGTFAVGDTILNYNGGGTITGNGTILSITPSNSSSGSMTLKILSGNLASNTVFYKSGNTITANIASSGYTDTTASANIMAFSSNVNLYVNNSTGIFSNGEYVVQTGLGNSVVAIGIVNFYTNTTGSNGVIGIVNANGVFKTNTTVYGLNSGFTATAVNFNTTIGVIDISVDQFIDTQNNYVYSANTGTTGTITRISSGSGASFNISPTFLNSEEVRVDYDYIRDYLTVSLNATAYGLSGNVSANSGSIILDSLTTSNVTIGTITSLVSENPGSDYDTSPFVTIFDPQIAPLWKHDYILKVSNTSASFYEGELITQDNTGAIGIIKSGSNNDVLFIQRIQYNNLFSNTDIITGDYSSSTAFVYEVVEDISEPVIGLNAVVTANVTTGNGVIANLAVFDSGFGYINDETATFTSLDGLRSGRVKISLETQGQSEGYYRSRGGFLSQDKYLHDGIYYQEYSYEVRSSVTLNKYTDMLKQVIHVAGTKFFGAYVKKSIANSQITLATSTITIS